MADPQPPLRALDLLKTLPLYPLPHHALSRLMMALTRIRTPWFKNAFIRAFSRHFNIDWQEALQQSPEDYEHFNAFFTRALKPDVRLLEGDESTIVCPADGMVSQYGHIEHNAILQAKGHCFSTHDLLGGRCELADSFLDGEFITIYLSPRDYHRVHMPCSGRLLSTCYIPGRLFSVAPHTVRTVPNLFARNERLVSIFETGHGRVAVILVGAIFVAAIETVWAGLVTPPHRADIEFTDYSRKAIQLERGAEMGRFNMGSTVIILLENKRIDWSPAISPEQAVKMGQKLGQGTG